MNEQEISQFIVKYRPRDYEFIACNLAAEQDVNYDFRMAVCELAKRRLSICVDVLVIDLYRALSDSAKRHFCLYTDFHLFANELVK